MKTAKKSFPFSARLRYWNRVSFTAFGDKTYLESWAIQLNPDPLDYEFWQKRDVEILDIRLEDYVAELTRGLQDLPLPLT